MKTLITFLFTCLILTSCQTTYTSTLVLKNGKLTIHSDKLNGEILDGYYHAPQGVFSFKIPEVKYRKNINEVIDADKNIWSIQTYDFYGNHYVVDIAKTESKELGSTNTYPENECQENYKKFFHSSIVTFLQKSSQDVKVVEECFVKLNDSENAYFAIFYLPCGSTAVNTVTKERFDARRAILLSFVDDLIVLIHVQESVSKLYAIQCDPELTTQYNEDLYKQAIQLRNSFIYKPQGSPSE